MRANLKGLGVGAIGGALGSAAVISVYLVATATARGADGGDWLNFAAVVFGVAATILGTLAIENIKERTATRAAIRDLVVAVDMWTNTVNETPGNLNPARFADLRQQATYMALLSADLGRTASRQRMAAHLFTYHAPAMIARLESALTEFHGAAQEAVVQYIVGEMRSYGATLRSVLNEY